ncbi:phage NrS-1 polymerase family protein [Staphylococcus borealis]|nr:hypothetical protein [Staphylococcus borealis]
MAIKEKDKIIEVNALEIPEELKELPQWVLWRAEWDNKKQEYKKVPYKSGGYKASSTRSDDWSSFNHVDEVLKNNDLYEGIGFVLSKGDNYVVLDIDNAIDENGQINSDLALEMTELTYCEMSPSGTGLHCFFKGELPEQRKKKRSDLDIELYDNERFMTVTGEAIGQSEICDEQEVLNNLVERYFKAEPKLETTITYAPNNTSHFSDDEVVDKMLKSKQKDKISDLLQGNYEPYFESPSEAVQSLLHYLAFYTGKDKVQMERIFLSYNNLTDKWDSKRGNTTWGQLELDKAINNQHEVYKQSNGLNVVDKDDWRSQLRRSATTQALKKTTTNAEIILANDESLKDMVQYDTFEKVTKLKRLPYWRSKDDKNYYWADIDTTHVISHIDRDYNVQFSRDIMDNVIEKEAYHNKFNPIKSMIESKEWDGVKRIETLFIDYLGAEDTHYNREVAKKWVMGAVARLYVPGIKYDVMVVLYGKQGGGKSTLASRMGGHWYNQSIKDFKGDEAYKKLQGSWICEIEELSAFQKSTIEEIKSFVTAIVDIYRASYGRRTERHPRQCVFIGTTNNYEFLKDKTGNRRFLPVTTNKEKATKSVFDDLTPDIVQQMYAEAKVYFEENPTDKNLLLDEEANKTALQMQEEHSEKDTLVGEIEEFLERPISADYWKLSIEEKRWVMSDMANRQDEIKLFGDGSVIQIGSNTKPSQYIWRDKVCSKEIWKVMMGNNNQPQQHHLRKIDEALRNIPYCGESKNRSRFGEDIGRQYGFDVDMSSYYKELE